MSIHEIHRRAVDVATRLRACEAEFLAVLMEVDKRRVFVGLGYSSLFRYAVEALGLSEDIAYSYISVARKAREVPALAGEIASGKLSASKARRLTPVLNVKNQERWLELAKTASKRQLEKQVALAAPASVLPGRMDYSAAPIEKVSLGANIIQLKVGISEELMLKIRHAQDLISRSRQKSVSLDETLQTLADFYLERKDPVARAKRQHMRGKIADVVTSGDAELGPGPVGKRTPFSAAVRNRLNIKFKGRCSHVDPSGRPCEQKRFLQVHHIKPVSEGGTNALENLELLCSGHHQAKHFVDTS